MTAQALSGGFSNPPHQSSHAFRAILESFARPGTLWTIRGAQPPAPLSVAAGTALLTLADGTTPVHLAGDADCQPVRDWITFHIGAPLVAPQQAMFAIGRWESLAPLSRFHIGAPDYPDRAATLIVLMDGLSNSGAHLTGPGIATKTLLSLPEIAAFQDNAARFPLGLDFLFVAGNRVAGLPRSTKVEGA
ncbi:phosphonate C-P lyase system protein PhnH [Pseudotabrizicola sp.]|uniref:phosphonate C-P lyase system protein PhnH n=1 Tax=Pseudotabrizicola sp. TaxID=2939647 RepID=UPI00271950D8|nr:phosphonate C-P lyase system protein PhnH [Pseudotabrizicola sp.]MDO8884637.1 phosphonate C-P lyase system protein PhnH [Pseudotabrizicola sp.]